MFYVLHVVDGSGLTVALVDDRPGTGLPPTARSVDGECLPLPEDAWLAVKSDWADGKPGTQLGSAMGVRSGFYLVAGSRQSAVGGTGSLLGPSEERALMFRQAFSELQRDSNGGW